MVKKFLVSIVSLVIVISVTAGIAGCGGREGGGISTSDQGDKYPSSDKIIKSKSQSGMKYDCTLASFTETFNSYYKAWTGKNGPSVDSDGNENRPLDKDGWTVMGKKSAKDGNTRYTYYSQNAGKAQILLGVEEDSGDILTFTTATTSVMWENSAKLVEQIAVIGSIACGGYKINDYKFFKKLFDTSISGNCYYNNALYKTIGEEPKEGEMIVKLMSIPCTEKALSDTEYTDYKLYLQDKCSFGQHSEK